MKYIKCPKCGEFFEENLESCPSCGWSESTSSPKVTVGEKITVATTDSGTKYESKLKEIGYVAVRLSRIFAYCLFPIYMIVNVIVENENSVFPNDTNGIIRLIMSLLLLLGALFAVGVISIVAGSIIQALCNVIANISINLHEINMKTKEDKTTEQ